MPRRRLLSAGQLEYLREIAPGFDAHQVAEALNKKYGLDLSGRQIYYLARHDSVPGLRGLGRPHKRAAQEVRGGPNPYLSPAAAKKWRGK